MNTTLLNACTSLLEQNMYLISTYFPGSWSMEETVDLYDSVHSLLYFLKAKTAWLIHSRCRGWNEDDLTRDFIMADIPVDGFLARILSDADGILSSSYIGGMTAAEHVGEDGPMVDNAQFLLDCISSRYLENIFNLFEMHKESFIFSSYNIWIAICENNYLCELIEQKAELEYYFNTQNKEKLLSHFSKKQLRKLYNSFNKVSSFHTCSYETFLLLLTETCFLDSTDSSLDEPEEFCVYVLSDYEPVIAYCKNNINTLTDEEAALYKCICAFEYTELDALYTIYWNADTRILSNGSKACFQTWESFSAPVTGENFYFSMYVNSFIKLSKLLKENHKL